MYHIIIGQFVQHQTRRLRSCLVPNQTFPKYHVAKQVADDCLILLVHEKQISAAQTDSCAINVDVCNVAGSFSVRNELRSPV